MSAAAILGAAVDAIWQGVLLCAIVELGLRLLPRRNAATLAAIWTAVLVACLGVTAIDVVSRHEPTAASVVARAAHATNRNSMRETTARQRTLTVESGTAAIMQPTLVNRISEFAGRVSLPIVLAALLIAAVRCSAVAFEIRATLRARRLVTRIEPPIENLPAATRAYGFAASATATTPHVLGLGRPLIVLPVALLEQPRERIRGVVVHELAHVHRHDDVRGAVEAVLAALLWWNPAIRFALSRCALLRERICDDAAISATHDGLAYATILAEIARGAILPLSTAPCFSTRHTVLERVRALLDTSIDRSPRPDRKVVAAAAIVATLLVVAAARTHVPVFADPITSLESASKSSDRLGDFEMHFHSQGAPELALPLRGTWTLATCADSRYLRLNLEFAAQSADGHENWSVTGCVPAAEFHGLSDTTLASASREIKFSIVRDAGTFEATGNVEAHAGSGIYEFVPSAAFIDRIRALGNGAPTIDQIFALAMADFQSVDLDALAAHGYPAPTPDELARLAYIGADPSFVLTAVALPAETKSVAQILELGETGFRTDEIAAIEGFGYHPTLEQFIRLAETGARPAWIARLRAGGYKDTNVEHLIELREQG
jgi:beta-lactamase regulating signal transducer with metallopeptidase domain